MPWLTVAIVIYGLLIALGGIIGYVTARSSDSLLTGGIIGLLLLGAGAWSKSSPKPGFGVAAVLALVVIGIFLKRYMETQKPMPAFGIIGLSAVMLVLLAVGLFGGTNTNARS